MEWLSFLNHHTFQVILLGACMIGFTCGALGTFTYVKHQGMLGDVLSHAALPGVALSFLIFQERRGLLIGAFVTGMLAVYLSSLVVRGTKTKEDSAQSIMLASFFGLGIILLSIINRMPNTGKSGLEYFLFGMTSSIVMQDVFIFVGLSVGILVMVLICWRPLKLVHFDPNTAKTLGISVSFYEGLTVFLLTAAIVTGLEMVGVILIISLIIAPATAARQWTHHLHKMFLLSGLIGALSSGIGATVSSIYSIPTGPLIVVAASSIALLSILAKKIGFGKTQALKTYRASF